MRIEWADRSGAFQGREWPMRLSSHPRRGATTQRPYDIGMIHFDPSVGPCGGAQAPVDSTQYPGGRVSFVEKGLRKPSVLTTVQGDAAGRSTITAGASRLLVIRLERPRQLQMDHRSHVGLVDAHSERVGSRDNAHTAVHEALLYVRPLVRGQARMVRLNANTQPGYGIPDSLDATSSRRIDDGRPGGRAEDFVHAPDTVRA